MSSPAFLCRFSWFLRVNGELTGCKSGWPVHTNLLAGWPLQRGFIFIDPCYHYHDGYGSRTNPDRRK
jgi:hypothetical protein